MSITGIDFLGKLLIILNKKATNEQQKSFDKIYSFYIISIIKQQKTVQINRTVPVIYELN